MKRLAILGCTGSIGCSTLSVVRSRRDDFQVVSMSAGRNTELLIQQAEEFRPQLVSVANLEDAPAVQQALPWCEVVYGSHGLIEVATHGEADFVIAGIVGAVGLAPTLAALEAGKDVGVANKETLVMAGHLMSAAAKGSGANILPVDSEHNALFQAITCGKANEVRRLIITASGGAVRDMPLDELANLTVEQALKHPNWSMGQKITVDSATMMNKALEVIEAQVLFDMPAEKISAVLHPQSIIHSMVEFVDGTIMAQLSVTDMMLPIQYALDWPQRKHSSVGYLDLVAMGDLSFRELDPKRYPCFQLAWQVLKAGNGASVVLNAANEEAVANFLNGQLTFPGIYQVVNDTLQALPGGNCQDLEAVLCLDNKARETANTLMKRQAS